MSLRSTEMSLEEFRFALLTTPKRLMEASRMDAPPPRKRLKYHLTSYATSPEEHKKNRF